MLKIVTPKEIDTKASAVGAMYAALRMVQEFRTVSEKYISIKTPTPAQVKKMKAKKKAVWREIDRAVTQAQKVFGLKK